MEQTIQDYFNGLCCSELPILPTIDYATTSFILEQDTAVNICPTVLTGDLPITVSVTPALPIGLSIDATTGCITGTPTDVTSAINYEIVATNIAGSSSKILNIEITPTFIEYPIKVQNVFSSKTEGDTYIDNALITTGGLILNSSFNSNIGLYTFEVAPGTSVGEQYFYSNLNKSTNTLYEDSLGLITTYGNLAFNNALNTTIKLGDNLYFGEGSFQNVQNSNIEIGSFDASTSGVLFGSNIANGNEFNFKGSIGSTTSNDGIFSSDMGYTDSVINTTSFNQTSNSGSVEGDINFLISLGMVVNFNL